MPTTVNGRSLGVETNGVFDEKNTDPIWPFGRLWVPAAAAWNDLRLYIGRNHKHWIAPAGPRSHARMLVDQWYFWNHRPPPAAYPGTSNHGWGIAVDVHDPKDAFYLKKYGPKFGWSHDEGARVGEWWHFRYVGTYHSPYLLLLEDERRWLYELRTLAYQKRSSARRESLHRAISERAGKIHSAAVREGWNKRNRRYRYKTLRRYR